MRPSSRSMRVPRSATRWSISHWARDRGRRSARLVLVGARALQRVIDLGDHSGHRGSVAHTSRLSTYAIVASKATAAVMNTAPVPADADHIADPDHPVSGGD